MNGSLPIKPPRRPHVGRSIARGLARVDDLLDVHMRDSLFSLSMSERDRLDVKRARAWLRKMSDWAAHPRSKRL